MPWARRFIWEGGAIAMPWCYDGYFIVPWLLCHGSAIKLPSHRHDNAILPPSQSDADAITMRWCRHNYAMAYFSLCFHSKDTAKRFPDVTSPYYSRHFNLRRKKLGFCDSWAAFLKKNNRRSDLTTHIILPHQSRYYSWKYKITSGVLIDFGTLPYLILWINTWYYDITILNTKNKIYEKKKLYQFCDLCAFQTNWQGAILHRKTNQLQKGRFTVDHFMVDSLIVNKTVVHIVYDSGCICVHTKDTL